MAIERDKDKNEQRKPSEQQHQQQNQQQQQQQQQQHQQHQQQQPLHLPLFTLEHPFANHAFYDDEDYLENEAAKDGQSGEWTSFYFDELKSTNYGQNNKPLNHKSYIVKNTHFVKKDFAEKP
jgi:hypothetical protein